MQSLNVGQAFEVMSHKAKTDHMLLHVLPFFKDVHLLCQEVCFMHRLLLIERKDLNFCYKEMSDLWKIRGVGGGGGGERREGTVFGLSRKMKVSKC